MTWITRVVLLLTAASVLLAQPVGGGPSKGGSAPAGPTNSIQTNAGSGSLGDSGCLAASGYQQCNGFQTPAGSLAGVTGVGPGLQYGWTNPPSVMFGWVGPTSGTGIHLFAVPSTGASGNQIMVFGSEGVTTGVGVSPVTLVNAQITICGTVCTFGSSCNPSCGGGGSVADPTDSPGQGTYATTQSVTLSDATSGATICYTNDGSSPAASSPGTCSAGTTYSTAISVTSTKTLKFLGTKAGMTNSNIVTSVYTISNTVADPTDSPGQGTYSSTQTVTLSTATAGATICYTTDGSTPAASTPGTCSAGTTYSSGFSVASTTTVKAIGTKSGMTNSGVLTSVYTIASFGFVSSTSKTGTPPLATNAYTTTSGAALVVTVGTQLGGSGTSGCSNNWSVSSTIGGSASGDTFTRQATTEGAGGYVCTVIFTATNIHAASGNYVITVSTSGAESYFGVSVQQFTGATTVDQKCGAYFASGTSFSCTTGSVTGSPEVVVGGAFEYTNSYTPSQSSPYTIDASATAGGAAGKVTSTYYIPSPASGTYSPTITWSANDAGSFSGVTLK